MKNKFRHRAVAMLLAAMMTAAPVSGTVFAADELAADQGQPIAAAEVKEEIKEEAKTEIKEEVKEEKESLAQEAEKAVEEKKAEAPAEAKVVEEVKAELAAPAAELLKEEKAETAAEEQAETAAEVESPVTISEEAVSQVTIHITNIMYTVGKSENGKAVPHEQTATISNGSTKSIAFFNNKVGGASVSTQTGVDGRYTFLKAFGLTSKNSGILVRNSASEVKAISKIGIAKGVTTVTFADGSKQMFENASDIYVSPAYSVVYNKTLSMNYIDNISTASGAWSGNLDTYNHTFKNPDGQPHYRFINWENKETGKTYSAGEKISVSKAECTETKTEMSFYTVWQPSVTVRYHYNGITAETESFEGINVYDKSAEIDGVEYNAWYDADGNILAYEAVFDAPAPVTEKTERTIYDVYARRPVTVTAASEEWTFDGQEHGNDKVSVTAGGLFEGDEIAAEVSGKITNVGKAENVIESVKIMRDGKDVSEYYDITTVNGALSIKAAPVPAATTDNSTPAAPQNRPSGRTAAAPQAAATAEIANTPVPQAAPEAVIADSGAPLAANGAWALLNLIMTVITGIISAVLLTGYFGKKEDEEDESDDAETKRKGLVRLASIIPAAGAIIAFILTEDMSLQMALTDRWTILMAVILLIQAVTAMFAKKEKEENEETAEAIN